MLDQGGAAFNPVPTMAINDVVDGRDFCPVNMPTDNAVNAEAAGFECHPRLEVADVLYGLLDLVLEESGERPVGKP